MAVDLKWRYVTHPPTGLTLSNGRKLDVFARHSVIIFSAILCQSILLKITSPIPSCQAIKYFACVCAVLPRHRGDILDSLSASRRKEKRFWSSARKLPRNEIPSTTREKTMVTKDSKLQPRKLRFTRLQFSPSAKENKPDRIGETIIKYFLRPRSGWNINPARIPRF